MTCGVLYFGSDLETGFAETLARFRPSMSMLALVKDEWEELGFMAVGSVAADWRPMAYRHTYPPSGRSCLHRCRVAGHPSVLPQELALGLSTIGLGDLDVSTVCSPDLRVTQMILESAYTETDGDRLRFAGIRYESRIQSGRGVLGVVR